MTRTIIGICYERPLDTESNYCKSCVLFEDCKEDVERRRIRFEAMGSGGGG